MSNRHILVQLELFLSTGGHHRFVSVEEGIKKICANVTPGFVFGRECVLHRLTGALNISPSPRCYILSVGNSTVLYFIHQLPSVW